MFLRTGWLLSYSGKACVSYRDNLYFKIVAKLVYHIGEEIISGAQRVHVPEFLAFESWLRGKALDPSKYKQKLGVIGKYRIANMTSLDSSLGPEIDLKVDVDISPDMKLEDLKLYDLIFFWLS